jgi:hypothetical protein
LFRATLPLLVSSFLNHLLNQRKSHGYDSSSFGPVIGGNPPTMLLDDPLDNRKSKTRSAAAARKERLKNFR